MNPVIIIPSRLEATRFPQKPLALIHGKPMIIHVLENAMNAKVGPVIVATPNQEIIDLVEQAGGIAVSTRFDHATGSDRIYEALQTFDPHGNHDVVINLQGDLPTITSADVQKVLIPLKESDKFQISTLVTPLNSPDELTNRNVVKAVIADFRDNRGDGIYFSRSPVPYGSGPHFHHAGIYAYRRFALDSFVKAPQSGLEKQESLEQLRALEMGYKIGVYFTESFLAGVDTPEDLALVTKYLS
ncbi:MAG: 3-deoxy-manno-octulosonate cytidylyltransferase [Alphaproteobacteria bacterium]